MPTLDWIGKQAVVNHHKDVPFHLLKQNHALSVGESDSGNLLIEGDNLLALKALLPYYAGKVKCIYIDPPYNTGNENWVYNDNVSNPAIQEWLGKVVGKEAEDLSRHDKWLCMMYPRLVLLRELLREDGVIFVSIDDNEVAHLRCIMDEIFGQQHHLATFIWKSRQHIDSRTKTRISVDHEYILSYGKNLGIQLRGRERDLTKFSNPDNDSRGDWMSRSILGLATKEQRPNLYYSITNPETGMSYPPPKNRGWRYAKETMEAKILDGCILFPKTPSGRPREKVFEKDLKQAYTGFPSVIDGIFTNEGTHEVRRIFGEQVFDFSKPPQLVKELIQQATGSEDIVLDSFAGSGSTGHAVLQLNREERSSRRFILIELEPEIARYIAVVRLRRVIEGYIYENQRGNQQHEFGLGGGFTYYEIGEPLFDAQGFRKEISFEDVARYVFFTETGAPMPESTDGKTPFLGCANGIGVYLLYEKHWAIGENVLTRSVLNCLPPYDGPKVIYGTSCRIGATTLKREGITFRQIPYDVRRV